mmetsp:Transcript_36579/g.95767  ORF Transcript_36579/g.95767 Transcript_36579/m.95767 type:complete len:245 (-) Transcript_36579:70-804(-)
MGLDERWWGRGGGLLPRSHTGGNRRKRRDAHAPGRRRGVHRRRRVASGRRVHAEEPAAVVPGVRLVQQRGGVGHGPLDDGEVVSVHLGSGGDDQQVLPALHPEDRQAELDISHHSALHVVPQHRFVRRVKGILSTSNQDEERGAVEESHVAHTANITMAQCGHGIALPYREAHLGAHRETGIILVPINRQHCRPRDSCRAGIHSGSPTCRRLCSFVRVEVPSMKYRGLTFTQSPLPSPPRHPHR